MRKKILVIILFILSIFVFSSCNKGETIDSEWKSNVLKSYEEFNLEIEENDNVISMIVTTDQHGCVKKDSEIYSYIDSIVDWDNISKIINLGDTVKLLGNKKDLNNYIKATECLPENKRIEVMGNHDKLYLGNRNKLKETYFSSAFSTKNDENNAFVVYDEKYNVRYLSVDTMQFPWTYKNGLLTTSQADFLISELEKVESSDIILLSHSYIFKDDIVNRDNEHFTGSDYFIGNDKKYSDVKESFLEMLSARNEKSKGVLLDCSGVEHPYDFTNCESELLMTLHGHHHDEGYEEKDGVTQFLFQSLRFDNDKNEPNCIYFAYIDRSNNIFKCWKIVQGKRYDAWTISIGN